MTFTQKLQWLPEFHRVYAKGQARLHLACTQSPPAVDALSLPYTISQRTPAALTPYSLMLTTALPQDISAVQSLYVGTLSQYTFSLLPHLF